MRYSFSAVGVLNPCTPTDITVRIVDVDNWHMAMTDGTRSSEMDSRYPGGDEKLVPWPWSPPDGMDPESRAAALDLLEWLGYHGERLGGPDGQRGSKFRPGPLRQFVSDEGYSNPAYSPSA